MIRGERVIPWARQRSVAAPALALLFLAGGTVLRWGFDRPVTAEQLWLLGLLLIGAPLVARTARNAMRGRWAADIIAALAITTAIVLGQGLAGLVIVLMQLGGEALETIAAGRASRALHALESAVPRIAHVVHQEHVLDVPIGDVRVGAEILVRPGEMVPCDGVVARGQSHVDTSALTGEPIARWATPGTTLASGFLNQESALRIRVIATAATSQYARIVELVRSAQRERAPLQRVADRAAIWFTPLTILVCLATWMVSGDPQRVLAVLVVATPCPLLLAPPIAMLGGIDLAARRRLIVRSGGALEALAGVTSVVLDKTGTLTVGEPKVSAIAVRAPWTKNDILGMAASVELQSSHPLARSVVVAAHADSLAVPVARHVTETPGLGVLGSVDGRVVAVGARSWIEHMTPEAATASDTIAGGHAGLQAIVTVDGQAAGVILFADQVRADAGRAIRQLRELGIARVMLLSGDRADNAAAAARELGITDALGDLHPADKVREVRALMDQGHHVAMVGDGTNDAPALAAADVGIALSRRGSAGVATEAADVVVLTDGLMPVIDAIVIARRTLRITRQSIVAGVALSAIGMAAAAAGWLAPVMGALVQEAIDVAVIVNALRAAVEPRRSSPAARGHPVPISPSASTIGADALVGSGLHAS